MGILHQNQFLDWDKTPYNRRTMATVCRVWCICCCRHSRCRCRLLCTYYLLIACTLRDWDFKTHSEILLFYSWNKYCVIRDWELLIGWPHILAWQSCVMCVFVGKFVEQCWNVWHTKDRHRIDTIIEENKKNQHCSNKMCGEYIFFQQPNKTIWFATKLWPLNNKTK